MMARNSIQGNAYLSVIIRFHLYISESCDAAPFVKSEYMSALSKKNNR